MNVRLTSVALAYAVLIAYASLYPFTWQASGVDPLGFLAGKWAVLAPHTDNFANLLAYLPLGLLVALCFPKSSSLSMRVIAATLSGAAFSFSMEFLQQYLPMRVPSQADLATNACGALLGALGASLFDTQRNPGKQLGRWRMYWVKPGRQYDLALVIVAAWALSQWLPGLPSFSFANLRDGLLPAWHTWRDPSSFDFLQWGRYALYLTGLALLVRTLASPGRPALRLYFVFVAVVLWYKVPVIGRQLSLEALAGAASAAVLSTLWLGLRVPAMARIAAAFIAGGLLCAHFLPGQETAGHLSKWTPLRGPIDDIFVGLGSVFEILWPPAALGYLLRIAAPAGSHRAIAWGGGAALATAIVALDWQAHSIAAVTILLMAGTLILFGRAFAEHQTPVEANTKMPAKPVRSPRAAAVYVLPALASAAVVIAANSNNARPTAQPIGAVRLGDTVHSDAESAEFEKLAKAHNVVRALRGDEPGFVNNDPKQYWLSEGSMRGNKTRVVYDTKIGGLRFDIVPTPKGKGASDIAGTFYFNFGKHFGPNERFRVRWQQMFNAAMLTEDIGGTAIKQAIIGSGDGPGLRHQASCTAPDIVLTTYYAFRFAQLYHSCGRYWGLYGLPRFNFQNMQPPVKGEYCNYDATEAQQKTDHITPPKACAGWPPAMQWQDYAIDVENGPIDSSGTRYTYSVVRMYIGKNADGTLHLAHEWNSRRDGRDEWKGLGLFVGDASSGERFFGKFWGLPYMTGYQGGHSKLMQTWYRYFIVTDETPSRSAAR